jgi:hypothetical protein
MSKKPYIYESLEGWLPITRKKSWFDPAVNPGDLAPYSEFQKPYRNDKDMSYPEWEWSWPDENLPPIDDLTYPDPVEHPCNVRDQCAGVGIIGPNELECDKCYPYTSAHVVLSCDPQWWMALSSWHLEPNETGCFFVFADPLLIATVCCPEDATGFFTLFFEGPLECSDSIDVEITCGDECCEELEVTGAATVSAGNAWVGSVSPPCGAAECDVVSNSGCSLSCFMNDSGSQLIVGTGSGDCGAFTVTVTRDADGECDQQQASIGVRIIGGNVNWHHDQSFGGGCGGSCGGGGVTYFNDWCILGEYKYGGFDPRDRNPCQGTWLVQCQGDGSEDCNCSGGGITPPCPVHSCGCSGGHCCCHWSWWRCDWTCDCDP